MQLIIIVLLSLLYIQQITCTTLATYFNLNVTIIAFTELDRATVLWSTSTIIKMNGSPKSKKILFINIHHFNLIF